MAISPDTQFIETKASLYRGEEGKRLITKWQFLEIFTDTMRAASFTVPADPEKPKRIAFGSVRTDGKIDPRMLFGYLDVARENSDLSSPNPRATIKVTLFTDTIDNLDDLVTIWREEEIFLRSTKSHEEIPFNPIFVTPGEPHRARTEWEVPLNERDPELYEHISPEIARNTPLFQMFSYERTYQVGDTTQIGIHVPNTLGADDEFVLITNY